jgi:hypothetical protein
MIVNLNPRRLHEAADILSEPDAPGAESPHPLRGSSIRTACFGASHQPDADIGYRGAAGYNLQALGILGQLVALGCRLAYVKTSTQFMKDKKATSAGQPPAAAASTKKAK